MTPSLWSSSEYRSWGSTPSSSGFTWSLSIGAYRKIAYWGIFASSYLGDTLSRLYVERVPGIRHTDRTELNYFGNWLIRTGGIGSCSGASDPAGQDAARALTTVAPLLGSTISTGTSTDAPPNQGIGSRGLGPKLLGEYQLAG